MGILLYFFLYHIENVIKKQSPAPKSMNFFDFLYKSPKNMRLVLACKTEKRYTIISHIVAVFYIIRDCLAHHNELEELQ